MTSAHSLRFSQSMTATCSDKGDTNTFITEEKLYSRRIKLYKHFMVAMVFIHASLISVSIFQLIFSLMIEEKDSCNSLAMFITIEGFYITANILLMVLFFVLWKNAEKHAAN